MPGAFDTITQALTGQAYPPNTVKKPAQPGGKYTGISDFAALKQSRDNAMRAKGLDPETGDPLPTPALRTGTDTTAFKPGTPD